MRRKSERQRADDLRSRFVANREKVRSWTATWDCPEVDWPPFAEVPRPWTVLPGQEKRWLARHAPFMQEYHWLLEARPRTNDISSVWASWWFGAGHEFEHLEIEFRSVPDPPYLAEKLALSVDAAAPKGWQGEDVAPLHAWLVEGIDSRPLHHMVHGTKRSGFVLFDLLRSPLGSSELATRLRVSLTTATLEGTPLDDRGRPVTG